MILRHGRENQRTVCNFSIWTVTDVYKKTVLWQRNRMCRCKIQYVSKFTAASHGSSCNSAALVIEIGSYLTYKEKEISWHSFFRGRVYIRRDMLTELTDKKTTWNALWIYFVSKQDAMLSLRRPRDAPNIWVPWKLCVSTKVVDDCARISTLQSYHYSAVKLFSKYSNKCDHGT